MNTTRLFLFLLLFPLCLFSKENKKESKELMVANYYYKQMDYNKAIPHYINIADSINDPAVFARLGDCYRATNNLKDAEMAYARAVKTPGCADLVKLHFAQVLMQDAQYTAAAKWLKEYQATNKSDKRVSNMIEGCLSAPQMCKSIPSGITIFPDFNTDGSEFAPTLWKGNLVFTSDTSFNLKKKTDNWTGYAYYNIYSISCDAHGKCGTEYKEVSKSKNVNIKYHDGPCTFSGDGNQMYFTRSSYADKFLSKKSVANKDSIVLLQIMIASDYDSVKKQFNSIKPFEYNSKDYSVAHPAISPNGKMLVFSSNMPHGAGGTDLYICRKSVAGEWAAPVNIGNKINTEGEEVFPYWADNTTLYFSSDGHPGLGGLDIYRCTYDEGSQTFSEPENMGTPINSSYDDISLAMYPDGRSTWLSSNRPALKGGDNIWYYKRQKLYLQINVTDANSKQPLTDAHIAIRSSKDTLISAPADRGSLLKQLYPDTKYTISVADSGYDSKVISRTYDSDKETDTVIENISLSYKKVYLSLKVMDSSSRQPLKNAHIVIRSATDSFSTSGDEDGRLFTALSPDKLYDIAINKESYYTRLVMVNSSSDKNIDTITKYVYLSHPLFTIKNFFNPKHIPEAGDTFIVNVPFVFAKSELERNSRDSLYEFAKYLNKYVTVKVLLRAHCDCRGGDQYNQDLSDRRAAEAVRFLINEGHIDPSRLQSVGLGSKEPRIRCNNCENKRNSDLKTLDIPDGRICTEAEHAQNRILDCIVLSK